MVFHAYCIIHPSLSICKNYVTGWLTREKIVTADIYELDAAKIGIAEIRTSITFLTRTPFASPKKAIIVNGNNLTHEAQQAFLKTLEEPSGTNVIFILASAEDFLLPTILSRTTIIKLPATVLPVSAIDQHKIFWKSILHKKIAERLTAATSLTKDRHQLKQWLAEQIECMRSVLLDIYETSGNSWISPPGCVQILRKLQSTHQLVEQNINLKLALDHLFIQIPVQQTSKQVNL